jgi:hypothetical protein
MFCSWKFDWAPPEDPDDPDVPVDVALPADVPLDDAPVAPKTNVVD